MDYSRQELVIGKEAQRKLESSKVTIIGIGALGSLASELLVRSGVSNLVLYDKDKIEESNLQRQHLFTKKDIGKSKVKIAKERLKEINPDVRIKDNNKEINYKNINEIKTSLILDCTDNLHTRFLLNDYCVKNNIKCIFSSGEENKGYVFSYNNKACFACLFFGMKSISDCNTVGVLNSITSLISSLQVNEAIKFLTGKENEDKLIYINLKENDFSKIKVNKRKDCSTCNGIFRYLKGKKYDSRVCKN